MSQKQDTKKEPTELEAAVLGALWQQGPCTAYVIRKEFLESASPRWSGSAGAIYPLLGRMERAGLVDAIVNSRGKRLQRDYVISKTGLTVFRRWLRKLNPETDTRLMHDPLRSKLFFLDAMTENQARRLVESALAELRDHLRSFERDCDKNRIDKNRASHFAARNSLLVTQARIVWLDEILQAMNQGKK